MPQQKIYKLLTLNKNSMLPGDLQGSPDESFSKASLVREVNYETTKKI